MKLSIKDRRHLWSTAAGICSYHFNGVSCGRELFTKNGEMDTNLGEECHIVGEKTTAARFQTEFENKETYNNAILLCNVHHKLVDDNPDLYTISVLKQMKTEHELIVSDKLRKEKILPFILKDCQFVVESNKVAEDVIGLDVQRPTIFSGVVVNVRANEARNVIGTRISGGSTSSLVFCPKCGSPFGIAYSGQIERPISECPYCHHRL
jgi:DNA-directed RNA polymerase subunit RPC12/RpoP